MTLINFASTARPLGWHNDRTTCGCALRFYVLAPQSPAQPSGACNVVPATGLHRAPRETSPFIDQRRAE
ncbi:MAG: hypothetical protein HC853_10140 [Anaerolineae bacterium]|nr:hypothetical protein [Anaerolineae bacterium]